MNIEKIEEYKKFYHDTLLNDVVPFWEKPTLSIGIRRGILFQRFIQSPVRTTRTRYEVVVGTLRMSYIHAYGV